MTEDGPSLAATLSRTLRWLLQVIGIGRPLPPPLELTVPDQLILRTLLLTDYLLFDDLVALMEGEQPTVRRMELLEALRKLLEVGLLERWLAPSGEERYRASGRGRKLQGVIPVHPRSNMDVYI